MRRVVLVRIVARCTSCSRSSAGVLVAIVWGVDGGCVGNRVILLFDFSGYFEFVAEKSFAWI